MRLHQTILLSFVLFFFIVFFLSSLLLYITIGLILGLILLLYLISLILFLIMCAKITFYIVLKRKIVPGFSLFAFSLKSKLIFWTHF